MQCLFPERYLFFKFFKHFQNRILISSNTKVKIRNAVPRKTLKYNLVTTKGSAFLIFSNRKKTKKQMNRKALRVSKEEKTMSSSNRSNRMEVPEAKAAMDRFKTEVASELGVNLKEGYNGDLTSKEAGSIGGEMVRRMIKSYEEGLK